MRTRGGIDRDRLIERGLSASEAARKLALIERTRAALDAADDPDVRHYWVPGRIEVLGKHTDYAGGRSLLCATERGFVVSVRARDDERVLVTDVVANVQGEFVVSPDQPARTHWCNYPATVARRLARNFAGPLAGAEIAFGSDLPRSSGLSSSTALVLAIYCALADRNRLDSRPEYAANVARLEDLAGYLGAVETGRTFGTHVGDNTGVGTRGGSQDHTAILCSRAGHLVGYRFGPVEREREVALPAGHTFVIASSGVAASKTGAARERYNRGPAMVAALLDRWREATGEDAATLGELHRRDGRALERLRALVARRPHGGFAREDLLGRLDQFVRETQVFVPDATSALAEGDLTRFGALVDQSQAGAEHGLRNQVPETIALARLARELGAAAASAFGAGFGGSVWALVATPKLERFTAAWRDAYVRAFPATAALANFFSTAAGPALLRL
jgi:galactokinase